MRGSASPRAAVAPDPHSRAAADTLTGGWRVSPPLRFRWAQPGEGATLGRLTWVPLSWHLFVEPGQLNNRHHFFTRRWKSILFGGCLGGKSLTHSVISIYTDQLQMLLSKCPDWFLKKSWRPYLDHLLKINGQQIVIDCKLRMKLVLSTKMGG